MFLKARAKELLKYSLHQLKNSKGAFKLEVKAVEKFIRVAPRKVRLVADLIREKAIEEAVDILTFTPKRAAIAVKKAIQSAVANAIENNDIKEDDLFIFKIFVDEGPTLKRFMPRARGRATKIRKRTSHLTVIVSDGKEVEADKVGSKSKS